MRRPFPFKCSRCGREVTESNACSGTNLLCKDCKHEIDREYKKSRRNDPNDTFRKEESERAYRYYHGIYRNRNRKFLDHFKTPCVKCGNSNKIVIDYHHIYPSQKTMNIGGHVTKKEMINKAYEIGQCVCLCRNCHFEFHYKYGRKPKNPKEDLEEYIGKSLEEITNERTAI